MKKQGGGARTLQPISKNVATGIKLLDKLLSGGFPPGAVVLVSGPAGTGKTIFSFQWLFDGVTKGESGMYITLTEPLFKSLKNLETMNFYSREAIESEKIKIVDLMEKFGDNKFNTAAFLNFMEEETKKHNFRRICIDSITAITYKLDDKSKIRKLIFDLGKLLASLGCTAILTSEIDGGMYSVYGVEEFISDGIIALLQDKTPRGRIRRLMYIVKMRGKEYPNEIISFRITRDGIIVFPIVPPLREHGASEKRIPSGNKELDKMFAGGLYEGSSSLITGPSGTGKSLFSMQFVAQGLKNGENCLYVGFEEPREQINRNAKTMGWDFEKHEAEGRLLIQTSYPREKLLTEHLQEIENIIREKKVSRCIIDSLSALQHLSSKDEFIDFVSSLSSSLKAMNVTSFYTSASTSFLGSSATLTEAHISSLFDNIITLRYVEIEGELFTVLNLVKVRGSAHSKGLRPYSISNEGINIQKTLVGYEGIISGITRKVSKSTEELLEEEFVKLLGPMGVSALQEIKEKGLTRENITNYIDSLVEQRIVKPEVGKQLKANVNSILQRIE